MKTTPFNKLNKAALVSLFVLTGIFSASSNAASVYNFAISGGVINTSGGITGDGFGTLSVSGTFKAIFTDTTIQITDINVSTNPGSLFAFPDYEGTFDGASFSGSQTIPLLGIDDVYSGTFDGTNFYVAGVYHEPFYDGYQYNYSISALGSPVPAPGALLLFISGLGFIGYKSRRSIS